MKKIIAITKAVLLRGYVYNYGPPRYLIIVIFPFFLYTVPSIKTAYSV